MDNITHSLFGYTLGHLASKNDGRHRKAAILTAVIGSNLPDLDVLFHTWGDSGPLGYLLQHRGYSHTVLLSLPLGVLSAWIAAKGFKLEFKKVWKLSFLGWLSVLLHIAADSSNNYGVHPFSPFWNHWIYGDFIFILEPLYWLACLPLVFFATESHVLRILSGLAEAALLALIWTRIFTPSLIAIGLSAWALLFLILNRKLRNPAPACIGILITLSVFALGNRLAKSRIQDAFLQDASQFTRYDLTLTPAPGDPLCWLYLTTGIASSPHAEKDYRTQIGVLSLAPSWISPQNCYFRSDVKRATPLAPATNKDLPDLRWIGEFRRPLSELYSMQTRSCRFDAFLRFSRVPVWYFNEGHWIMGDLRYDSGKGTGFAQLKLESNEECPRSLPPWTPPIERIINSPAHQ